MTDITDNLDIVSSDWHEGQQYITSCGNVRFFDQW